MRLSSALLSSACLALAASACDSGAESPKSRFVVNLGVETAAVTATCIQLRVVDPTGVETAVTDESCSSSDAPIEVAAACEPSADPDALHEVFLRPRFPDLVMVDDTPPQRDVPRVQSPCPEEGCRLTARCVAGEDTVLTATLILMPESQQGFLDLNVSVSPRPESLVSATYEIEVLNAEGTQVLPPRMVGSDTHGDGPGGAISYISPCDAFDDTNTVKVALKDLIVRELAAGTNEATERSVIDAYDITCEGGCTQTFACEQHSDTAVGIQITLTPR